LFSSAVLVFAEGKHQAGLAVMVAVLRLRPMADSLTLRVRLDDLRFRCPRPLSDPRYGSSILIEKHA
jgi:hypothetical protein